MCRRRSRRSSELDCPPSHALRPVQAGVGCGGQQESMMHGEDLLHEEGVLSP